MALAAAMLVSAVPGRGAPNVIFMMADDLGIGDTGITGQNARLAMGLPGFATPNIDSIANRGSQFRNMYAGGPTCGVSRAAFLTGFSNAHSVFQETSQYTDIRSGDSDRTWGQTLQDAGYSTAMFGKWHLGGFSDAIMTIRTPGAIPTQKGFETAFGGMTGGHRRPEVWASNDSGGMSPVPSAPDPTWPGPVKYVYQDDEMTSRVVDYLRERASTAQPFAAHVAFKAPHTPLSEVPQDHPYVGMPWPKAQRDYAGMIWRLDQHVGQILAAIDDPNGDGSQSDSIADNTIIVFTSDNGPLYPTPWLPFDPEFFDSNGIYTAYKASTQAGGVRAPFFVRWDGVIAPGSVRDEYAAFVDILPTLAELTGQEAPLGIDGQSILPMFTGEGTRRDPNSYLWMGAVDFRGFQFDGWAIQVANWKLFKHRRSNTFKLFNLTTDPQETVNLAASRPDIKAALESIAHAEGTDREPEFPWPDNPEVTALHNTYFVQYKTWAPQGSSQAFEAASNWSGGTQYDRAGSPEAQNWNTGPADNWAATMANSSTAAQVVSLTADASVLGLDIRGPSTMLVNVDAGVQLSARNGLRVSSGGRLRLRGGEINTTRDIEVRNGGRLEGEGVIDGQQAVVAGIPEFQGLGLFEPRVVNSGVVDVASAENSSAGAGVLQVRGDYLQQSQGRLLLDVLAPGSDAGAHFDQLQATGSAKLGGVLELAVSGSSSFSLGHSFDIITAAGGIVGRFDRIEVPTLGGGLAWLVEYTTTAAKLTVVSKDDPLVFLSLFRQSFGVDAAADRDHDGDTDGRDLLLWQRGIGRIESSTTQVPEPLAPLTIMLVLSAMRPPWRRLRVNALTAA
jgi:arylsulfatase A-like enzyme